MSHFLIKVLVAIAVLGLALPALAAATNQPTTQPMSLRGQVVSSEGGNLVVKSHQHMGLGGEKTTILTDANTKVTLDGKVATLADLKPGYRVKVTPAVGTATSIYARSPENNGLGLAGKVVSSEGGNLVIKQGGLFGQGGKTTTVATDANTKVTLDGKPATLADLKPGYHLKVLPGTGTATEIRAKSSNPAPSSGS